MYRVIKAMIHPQFSELQRFVNQGYDILEIDIILSDEDTYVQSSSSKKRLRKKRDDSYRSAFPRDLNVAVSQISDYLTSIDYEVLKSYKTNSLDPRSASTYYETAFISRRDGARKIILIRVSNHEDNEYTADRDSYHKERVSYHLGTSDIGEEDSDWFYESFEIKSSRYKDWSLTFPK